MTLHDWVLVGLAVWLTPPALFLIFLTSSVIKDRRSK